MAFVSSVIDLASPATRGLPIWFFYLALSPSLLMLFSAYSLWRKEAWAIVLLPIAGILRAAPYLFMMPSEGPSLASTLAGQLLERLPPRISIETACLIGVALYCAFLRKWSAIR